MKLEMIKSALKARTMALNIKLVSEMVKVEEKIAPVAPVAVKPQVNSDAEVGQKNGKPAETVKNTAATAPVQPTLMATEDKGDTVKPEPVKKSDSDREKTIKPQVKVESVITASEFPPIKNQPVPAPVKPEVEEKPPVAKKPARSKKKAETEAVPAVKVEPPELNIETVIRTHLKAGVDYDTIPNCGRKPTLLKAGAEHLAAIYGFRTTSEIVNRVEVLEKTFVLYEFKTTVYNAKGEVVAIGYGSANTQERKFMKQGFAASLNVVLKIARKRSFVDAVLTATSASRIFTQDIEELRESATIIPIDAK